MVPTIPVGVRAPWLRCWPSGALRGDASSIWRWVQAYAPELNKRCRPHLRPTNKSYRIDETYIRIKGQDRYLLACRRLHGPDDRVSVDGETGCGGGEALPC